MRTGDKATRVVGRRAYLLQARQSNTVQLEGQPSRGLPHGDTAWIDACRKAGPQGFRAGFLASEAPGKSQAAVLACKTLVALFGREQLLSIGVQKGL